MSSSSSTRNTVSLYRYDLTQGMARSLGPMLIGRTLEGIWHTSIVVYGKEYYFDGGVGIIAAPNPGSTRFGQPYRTEVLGATTKREEEFFAWTQQQSHTGFGPNDYNVLHNNCNSFSDAASLYLLGRHIPQDVLDMIPTLLSTPLGQMLRPILEQATSGAAEVSPADMRASPSYSLAPPPSPPTTAGSREACAGLLSAHRTVTDEDEEDLMVAQAMLESNETIADGHLSPPGSFERTLDGLTLLRTVMLNICEHPTNAKYRALSTESTAYQTKLKPLETYGVTEMLRIAGFHRRPHSSGTGGEQWFLSDSDGNAAVLSRVAEVLDRAIANIQSAADEAAKKRGRRDVSALAPEQVCEGSLALSPSAPRLVASVSGAAPAVGHAEAALPSSSALVAKDGARTYTSSAVQFCTPPFLKEWVPLPIGKESGKSLFFIHVLPTSTSGDPYGFGKCCLSADQQHLQAHYCTTAGREAEIHGGYEVLCVRRGEESALTWVPVPLASAAQIRHSTSFIISAYHRFGVVRAEHGGGLHPGVMEPSGRCVVPYGGRAVVVTDDAEVLCEMARLPQAVLQELEALQRGTDLAELLRVASGKPIGSFDELLSTWQPPIFYMKPRSLRPHTVLGPASVVWCGTGGSSRRTSAGAACAQPPSAEAEITAPSAKSLAPRLLVCHDMCGGYMLADRRVFLCKGIPLSASASAEVTGKGPGDDLRLRLQTVEGAYTVSYWNRADCFVYFSHKRITVPPREWIDSGHSHGVPVLGTLLTEGDSGAADLRLLLTDARRMAAIIARLVEVCNTYGFDGYLVNIENDLPKTLAKRLVIFCTQLRKQLNCSSSAVREASSNAAVSNRLVIWYDAVTIDGQLSYQNALNSRNKPFFDSSDGIFTNYFWNPMHLSLTKTVAGIRSADAYVGVDVYGRNMYGGGGYNTHVAVGEAVRARLSVALFAPAWTMECRGEGRRDCFQRAESRMWSRMQEKFTYHARLISSTAATADVIQQPTQDGAQAANHGQMLCAWTSFHSGVGYDFYVNGCRITGGGTAGSVVGTSGWCEVSSAHGLPPFLFQAPPSEPLEGAPPPAAQVTASGHSAPFAALPIRLPATSLKHSVYGGVASAEWRYDKAWFGDCHLACVVPPMGAAEVLRWYVREALPATPFTELHIEVVLDEAEGARERAESHRGLHLALLSATGEGVQISIWEQPALASAVAVDGVNGIVARVFKTSEVECDAGSDQKVGISRWVRVLYQLRNISSEPFHLTSVSIANRDPHQTLNCGVGGIGISQWRVETSTEPTGEETQSAAPVSHHSLLHADGPYYWSHYHTLRTRRASERVLTLEGADHVFARLRAEHGAHASIVVFASVVSAATEPGVGGATSAEENEPASRAMPSAASHRGECHTMYVGQYPIHLEAGATYEGSLPIPVSLPSGVDVVEVQYYTVSDGY
ncbi:hypothetical protein JKF63_02255 [Porcisia hertigi]|uniref:mannosyl-glycoprotein endo-beta-N-acetylglucosaminidase n=1 Tax=Porcisia hertigi TaxID=2761500 RepID=A0A836L5C8_9TRYP|nr:hypothetical protein JKF63_02255 [Porcisia hertigi]